ncbi:MAG: ATPase, partial [Candidatus Methanomethylicia archaeon]
DANIAVERLLRQGRKYRLHGWISTQRVAHLNVNAIQQIQSFFTGTLPREYDRRVIAEAAGISPDILDKTAYLDVGEWLFISFRATKLKNIPVFIKTEDNEDILSNRLLRII